MLYYVCFPKRINFQHSEQKTGVNNKTSAPYKFYGTPCKKCVWTEQWMPWLTCRSAQSDQCLFYMFIWQTAEIPIRLLFRSPISLIFNTTFLWRTAKMYVQADLGLRCSITKTSLFKIHWKFYHQKKTRKFSDKKFDYSSYLCSKYRLFWVLIRTASVRRF